VSLFKSVPALFKEISCIDIVSPADTESFSPSTKSLTVDILSVLLILILILSPLATVAKLVVIS